MLAAHLGKSNKTRPDNSCLDSANDTPLICTTSLPGLINHIEPPTRLHGSPGMRKQRLSPVNIFKFKFFGGLLRAVRGDAATTQFLSPPIHSHVSIPSYHTNSVVTTIPLSVALSTAAPKHFLIFCLAGRLLAHSRKTGFQRIDHLDARYHHTTT